MDRTIPVEFMLRGMEEIQMFLLENPEEEHKLTEVLMISYTLNNMFNDCLYGKDIELWNNLPTTDRKQWVEFRSFLIYEYECMLREGQGSTNAQEGYSGMFN